MGQRGRGRRGVRAGVLGGLAALFIATPAIGDVGATLKAYESAAWPAFLSRLDLDPDRRYVVLAQMPPAHPIDLRDPESARRSLARNALDLSARLPAKTAIGHFVVGWQCSSGRGITSKTGEGDGQGVRMALTGGWGLTPFLSVYHDGRLLDGPGGTWRHIAVIDRGGGNVLVAEVTEQRCQQLRRFLAHYITHPNRPVQRYGLLLEPGRFEGGACHSLAMVLAVRAGLFAGSEAAFRRRLAIHDEALGRRHVVPAGVEPYVRARSPGEERIVPFARLRDGPWNTGALHARETVVDPELIFAAITRMRRLAGAVPGWREARALPASDPAVARVNAAAVNWARGFPRRRIADPWGTSALVLER